MNKFFFSKSSFSARSHPVNRSIFITEFYKVKNSRIFDPSVLCQTGRCHLCAVVNLSMKLAITVATEVYIRLYLRWDLLYIMSSLI